MDASKKEIKDFYEPDSMKLFSFLYLLPILFKLGLKNSFFDISKFCFLWSLWLTQKQRYVTKLSSVEDDERSSDIESESDSCASD